MNRRGIALLTTLWLLAALSVAAASTLTLARLERDTAVNRVALTRGRWAADACLALMQGALAQGGAPRDIDSTDLGGGLWCRAVVEDLGATLSVEVANAEALGRLVGDPERTAALLDWIDPDDAPRELGAEGDWYRANGRATPRNAPLGSLDELYQIRGFDPVTVARLGPSLSVRGSRRLNVNVASRELLSTLPGLEQGAVEVILAHRERGDEFRDLDGLLATLPTSLRAPALARYAELQGSVTFTPERVVVHLDGHVPEAPIVAREAVVGVLAPSRLAILTREEW